MKRFLSEKNEENKWSNHTYNNYQNSVLNIFSHLAEPINGIIPYNPLKGIQEKPTLSLKPSAYTDEELNNLLSAVRRAEDLYMEGIILTCYYACVRSKAEMRALKAENILFDRNLLLLSADGTKARREDYIPLDPILKAFYLSQGFDKLPGSWYLIKLQPHRTNW